MNKLVIKGLTEQEAQERLNSEGYNELPSSKKRSVFFIAFEVAKEPMFILLVSCGIIYLILGDVREAIILMFFVFVIMCITFIQERKTERALESLRDLTSPRASVLRDGQKIRIAGREVVRGDIMILAEGDRIPADAILLESQNLSIDESLLTGESVPVMKYPDELDNTVMSGGENQSYLFSGTMVVQGQGIAEVVSVGTNTKIGKIGKSLQVIKEEETILKKDIRKTVKVIGITSAVLCVAVIIIYGITRSNWLNGFLAGITLAMAMIPEEFPVVLTVFMSLGAWRISQKRVLTRRIPAVETLGSATVLCVDKTGTLTMNIMRVQQLCVDNEVFNVPKSKNANLDERFHEIVEYGILASQTDPFDPMEKAIRELGEIFLTDTEHIHNDWTMIQEYPLSKSLLAMSRVWKKHGSGDYTISAKGSPEAIMDLCHFDSMQTKNLEIFIEQMAKDGLRVIAVAKSRFKPKVLPEIQHDFDFKFEGLIGLADPVREQVPASIKECYNAHIRVVMITGDYPVTAQNIASQIGLKNKEKFITGQELDNLDDEELCRIIKDINIFARVVPEQKYKIVNGLKKIGEIVAMTGDGVNDAPALKAANIGIAMGGRGTDVARESASLVLLDDDFSSIVTAVKMGRRIFDNLKKAISYILAIHIPIVGLSLITVILKWPLILFPVHIVFLELIIDPACSLVFEAESEEKDIMIRPPRNVKESLFCKHTVVYSILQGLILLIIVTAVFVLTQHLGENIEQARALSFVVLIIGNIGLIMSNRSWTLTIPKLMKQKNTALVLVIFGAITFLILVLFIPILRNIFRFGPLHIIDIIICISTGIISIVLFEVIKFIRIKN